MPVLLNKWVQIFEPLALKRREEYISTTVAQLKCCVINNYCLCYMILYIYNCSQLWWSTGEWHCQVNDTRRNKSSFRVCNKVSLEETGLIHLGSFNPTTIAYISTLCVFHILRVFCSDFHIFFTFCLLFIYLCQFCVSIFVSTKFMGSWNVSCVENY